MNFTNTRQLSSDSKIVQKCKVVCVLKITTGSRRETWFIFDYSNKKHSFPKRVSFLVQLVLISESCTSGIVARLHRENWNVWKWADKHVDLKSKLGLCKQTSKCSWEYSRQLEIMSWFKDLTRKHLEAENKVEHLQTTVRGLKLERDKRERELCLTKQTCDRAVHQKTKLQVINSSCTFLWTVRARVVFLGWNSTDKRWMQKTWKPTPFTERLSFFTREMSPLQSASNGQGRQKSLTSWPLSRSKILKDGCKAKRMSSLIWRGHMIAVLKKLRRWRGHWVSKQKDCLLYVVVMFIQGFCTRYLRLEILHRQMTLVEVLIGWGRMRKISIKVTRSWRWV